MICTIDFNILRPYEFSGYFKKIRRSSILQSPAYAYSQFIENKQKNRVSVLKIDGEEAGLVSVLEVGILKNVIHAVIVDRGPLWFEGYGTAEHFAAFCDAFNAEFPNRFGRRRRFIPEVEDTVQIREILKSKGFKRSNAGAYETIWLDLTQNEDLLLQGLKKKWRGSLRKAQRAEVKLEWDDSGVHLPWLLQNYAIDKMIKNYDGPSLSLIQNMARSFTPSKDMLIGRVLMNDKPIAAILIFCHGRSATYQIGWSSQDGREHAAHYLLLWDSLRTLKNKGIKDFDLGGVNDQEAKGVKHFKSGMGGTLIRLPGIYH